MKYNTPANPEWDILYEIKNIHQPGELGKLMAAIGEAGGLVGDINTKSIDETYSIREITISVKDESHRDLVAQAIRTKTSAEILSMRDLVFEKHKGGKIHSARNENVNTISDLRYIYTPGVARVCLAIKADETKAREYTNIAKSVGIFTNGTRILGLGDIGPVAGMPVMEGKAVLYDQFAGLSATPILVNTKDPEEFIRTVINIAPTFGGIHLEDIRTPDCFYIEDELIKRLNQPVMHDDQHGTATVTLAAILSAMRMAGHEKRYKPVVAQIGLGAAGFGIAKLLIDYGWPVIGVDLNPDSQKRLTDYGGKTATLAEATAQAEVVVATTGIKGLIKPEMVRKGQIILSLTNPDPEIDPADAMNAGAAYAADGKSINNALAFPGLFRGALEVHADSITPAMKIAAAEAISVLAEKDELVPSIFNPKVHDAVTDAAKGAWVGV